MAALVTALAAGPVVVTQTGDAHVSVSGGIVSVTGDDPTVTFQLSDATSISITSSKTLAVDGDLMVPGVPVSLKAKKITVAGRTIDWGTADVAITADDSASGTNLAWRHPRREHRRPGDHHHCAHPRPDHRHHGDRHLDAGHDERERSGSGRPDHRDRVGHRGRVGRLGDRRHR